MSGPSFFETPMGRRFYESTMPKIAEALERLAASTDKVEQLATSLKPARVEPATTSTSTQDDFLAELVALLHKYDVGLAPPMRAEWEPSFRSTDGSISLSLGQISRALFLISHYGQR